MDSKGMMAIVRGLPDSGLMVTLMDGGKQYTLLPQTGINTSPTYDVCNNYLSRQSQCGSGETRPRHESGAQAVDGRYASSYKIEYCHMKPTSPPVELTEFPPQRARLQPGRGNFEVGGFGSGGYTPRSSGKRTYSNCRATATGNMSGSNAYTSSLRKYPSVSPDSSSEVFERLISFTKPSDASRINYPNDCLTCYQTTPTNRYPKYKNFDINKVPTNRQFDASPTRYEGFQYPECSNVCKFHEHINDMVFGNDSKGIDTKNPYRRMHSNNARMHGSKVVSDAASDVATFNESSFVDIAMSKLVSDENLTKERDSNLTLEPIHLRQDLLQDNKSMQTLNSLIEMGTMRKTKAQRKPKKMKNTNQSPTKRKNVIRKPRLHDDNIESFEQKRLKSELLALITELNKSKEYKIEERLRDVLCKTLNCILRHRKPNNFKQCKNCIGTEPVDCPKQTLDVVWQKYSNEATEIQRVIKEDILAILKYHVFKEHENEVTNIILSKIIKDIIGVVTKIEYKYSVDSRNSFEDVGHLGKRKSKEIRDTKKLNHNMYKRSPGRKCRRYPNALRNLVKTETTNTLNKNILEHSKDPIDLKLQSIVNIYQVLKKIQSSSEFQANYVTSMLLNRFCTTKAYVNQMNNFQQKTRPYLSPAKCISDTYVMIHDSSRNKSILTKKKIDKMNLHGGTKLLTSIKNKHTVETSLEHIRKKYELENITHSDKPQTTCHDVVYTRDNSVNPFSIERPNEDKRKVETTKLNHVSILQQIEEKIRQWLNKYEIYTITNNVCYDNILRSLTEDITTQLKLLNQSSAETTRSESVTDYLKCVICKYLFLPGNGQSFELAQKLSELTKDVLSIFTLNSSENGQIKTHGQSPTPSISREKQCNTPKPPNLLPGSHFYQADKSIMKDIYSKIMFCDENILQVLPRDLLNQDTEGVCEEKCRNGEYKNRENNIDKVDSINKSGEVKVVLTSTNTNNSEKTENKSTNEPNSSNQKDVKNLPENATRQQLHEYCVETFRNYCKELPILATNPDLTELAREGVLHNILKLFYMLIEDSYVENDYTYFEFCFEDEIDGLLDVLPQTEEMKKMRQGWKIKVVMEAVKILKFMHKTKDDTEFKQKLNQVSDRRKLMVEQKLDNEYAQQLNALRMAEKCLTSSNYRELSPLKEKVYLQRLMDRANQIYESVKRKEGKPFLELSIDGINETVFQELQTVRVPNNDIERQEIVLVEINNEIEAWFNELPVIPSEGVNSNKRKILKQSLARKIHSMEMNLDLEQPAVEREMKHEISVFLSDKAVGLEKDQDLNINEMVEELSKRLKRRRDENSLDYESFKKHLPFSSSIQKLDNSVNVDLNKSPYINQNVKVMKNNERVHFEDQIANEDKIVRLQPIRRSTEKGILGTSQIPGPSSDEAYLTLSTRPRSLNTQEASLRYPNTSSRRRKIFDPEELNEISKYFSFEVSSDKNGYNRMSKFDQNPSQRSDYHSIRGHALQHNANQNNFLYDPRQVPSKSQYIGHTAGTMPTAQAVPPYVKPINYNTFRDDRNDYDMDYERERDQSRVRCKCGETSLRRRRRHSCHCEDFYPMPSCCFLHNDF